MDVLGVRGVIRHISRGLNVCRRIHVGDVVLMRCGVGIMMMFNDIHHSGRHIVMLWSTRRLDDSSDALNGQSGYQ
jgi:hypothetical protein